MAERFYTILTAIGKSKLANAAILGNKITFKTLKVGDGNGTYYEPAENQTSLRNKVWEGNINSISIDNSNLNWIEIEIIMPATDGGFFIREAGIFDEEDNLIAVSKISETYKPVMSEGSTKDLVIKILLEVSNINDIALKIDPNVTVATKNDIQILQSKFQDINTQLSDIKNKTNIYKENAATTDDYVISITGITSYDDILGIPITIKATVANTTSATLNVNSYGAKSIVRGINTELQTGDIPANKFIQVIWDGTYFQLQSQAANVVDTISTQSLSNKTLTAVKLGSAGYIADANGNEILKTVATVNNAVNEVTIGNAATGVAPTLAATGNDTNINLNLIPKGTGRLQENGINIINESNYVRSPAYAVTTGTSTAYAVTTNPAPTAYTDGMQITIVPHVDCGINPTLNWNGLGALTILNQDGSAINAGDIKANKPLPLVRVGSNFFICSGNPNQSGLNKAYYSLNPWVYTGVSTALGRYAFGCVAIGNKIYCIGGIGSGYYKTVTVHNTLTNTWSTETDMSAINYAFGCVAVGTKIYCIGGNSNYTYIYDTVAKTWSIGAVMPVSKTYFGCVAVGTNIYCIGNDNTSDLTTYVYNTPTNTWSIETNMPSNKSKFGCIAVGTKIFCVGGYNSGYLATVNIYDTVAKTWSVGTQLTYNSTVQPMADSGYALVGDYIYCVGGYYNTSSMSATFKYNVITQTTTECYNAPTARYSLGCVAVGINIYCYFGYQNLPSDNTYTIGRNLYYPKDGHYQFLTDHYPTTFDVLCTKI